MSINSSCTTGKEELSHVLTAMGFKANEVAHVLRFNSDGKTLSRLGRQEYDLMKVYTEVYHAK